MSLSSQLKRARWRWVLSIPQFVLALALSLMLNAEAKVHNAQFETQREAQRAQGWELRMEFDYVPRTFVWMVVFDFPAIVAAAPFGMTLATRIGPFFVLFAGLFWYWCGRGLERRWMRANERSRPGIAASVLNGVGLICSLALLISVLWSGPGGSALTLFAAVGWCAAFAVYFGARLARRWPPATWPSRERSGPTPD